MEKMILNSLQNLYHKLLKIDARLDLLVKIGHQNDMPQYALQGGETGDKDWRVPITQRAT